MVTKFSCKANSGKYRVTGYDQYDYSSYYINEFSYIWQALFVLWIKSLKANAEPAYFSDIYFIYNDNEKALYKGTFVDGIVKL